MIQLSGNTRSIAHFHISLQILRDFFIEVEEMDEGWWGRGEG